MHETSVTILDVGHGNSAVLRHKGKNVVLDTGPGEALLHFFAIEGIWDLSLVIVSHADADHLGGLINLLTNAELFKIATVRVNPDSGKGKVWEDFLFMVGDLQAAGKLTFVQATSRADSPLVSDEIMLEVLSPTVPMLGMGPNAYQRSSSQTLSSNSCSIVLRLSHDEKPIALFAGDIDNPGLVALEEFVNGGGDCSAPILIFPHHGGLPGGWDPIDFTQRLCKLIKPQTIVFSIGRNSKAINPRPEIIRAIRQFDANIRIVCTQLSKHCAERLPAHIPAHLQSFWAPDRNRECCGGSLVLEILNGTIDQTKYLAAHKAFIDSTTDSPLCLRPNWTSQPTGI